MSSLTIAAPEVGLRQELFVNVYQPVLVQRFSYHFRRLNPDARAEATQDCMASAWARFSRAGDRAWNGSGSRIGKMTPSLLADFIARSYLADGREFLGTNTTDAMAPATHKAGRTSMRRLHRDRLWSLYGESEDGDIPEALITKSLAGPLTQVRAREDWRLIADHCRPKARRVLQFLARGLKPSEIAGLLGVSPARVTALKYELASVVSSFGYGPKRWQVA
jgi:hypothetical protein